MPRRPKGRRVLGPYKKRGGSFAVVSFDGEGTRDDREFETEAEALAHIKLVNDSFALLDATTVEMAITEYKQHLADKGTKERSYTETVRRLRLFFAKPDRLISSLTKDECTGYYARFRQGRSVDYHRNTLAESRSFMRWCVSRSWCKANPLADVQGVGRRSKGKKQLTGDESHRFMFAALWRSSIGDTGALGCALLLGMGLRQSEVWKRVVRDLDRNGTVLRIEDAKTKAGERQVTIPDYLQPHVAELVRGRLPLAPLFATSDGGHHTKAWLRGAVKRVCKAANVTMVTPHGLRGTFVSLAEQIHSTSQSVAASIGHAGMSAYGNYARPEAVQSAVAERALKVITGGKR